MERPNKRETKDNLYLCEWCDRNTNCIYANKEHGMWLCEECNEDAGGFDPE